MVRESSYCVTETSDAECVSHAQTVSISLPGFATRGRRTIWEGGTDIIPLFFPLGSSSYLPIRPRLTRMYTHQQD